MGESEIAQLRQQIDSEIEAARLALQGYAQVSRHDIITHHFDALGGCLEQLQQHIGKEKATEIIIRALDKKL